MSAAVRMRRHPATAMSDSHVWIVTVSPRFPGKSAQRRTISRACEADVINVLLWQDPFLAEIIQSSTLLAPHWKRTASTPLSHLWQFCVLSVRNLGLDKL
jgi:ABC-type sulfate transport system substrate-binding protein